MKKLIALFLALLTVSALLVSCTGGKTNKKEEILVWVAEEVVEFTKTQCDAFLKARPEVAENYTIRVSAMGEGETATQMLTDARA